MSETVAQALIVLSAAIVLLLGTIHLVYTFFGPKLKPRDPTLQAHMSQVPLVITRETTVWRAWIGFNASQAYWFAVPFAGAVLALLSYVAGIAVAWLEYA